MFPTRVAHSLQGQFSHFQSFIFFLNISSVVEFLSSSGTSIRISDDLYDIVSSPFVYYTMVGLSGYRITHRTKTMDLKGRRLQSPLKHSYETLSLNYKSMLYSWEIMEKPKCMIMFGQDFIKRKWIIFSERY